MIYPGLYSGAIGSLLRQIQEQKSQSPVIPPSTESNTAVRGIIEQPNQTVESPGTSRMVNVRPETSQVAGPGSAIDAPTMVGGAKFAVPTDLGAGPGVQAQVPAGGAVNFAPPGSPGEAVRPVRGVPQNIPALDLSESSVQNIAEAQNNQSVPGSQFQAPQQSQPQSQPSQAKQNDLGWLSDIHNSNKQFVEKVSKMSPNEFLSYTDPGGSVLGAATSQQNKPAKVTHNPFISTANVGEKKSYSQPSSASQAVSKVTGTLKQSPISWLATKIFGR